MSGCDEVLRYCAVLATILLAGKAIAAEQADVPVEELYFTELPVVLHATRLNQTVEETPASMTIIDREMIEASSATTIQELLRFVPGYQVSHKKGSDGIPSNHGIPDDFSRRIKVLINGRSIFNLGALGGINWSMFPITLDEVERVEVVRSSNAAAYGSNAYMGSINIVTRDATYEHGTRVRLDAGSNALRGISLSHTGSLSDSSYSLNLFHSGSGGLADMQDDWETSHFSFRGEWLLNNTDRLEYTLASRRVKEEQVRTFLATIVFPDTIFNSQYKSISWSRSHSSDDEIKLSLIHNTMQVEDIYSELSSPFNPPVNVDFSTELFDVELQQSKRLNDQFRYVWGVGASNETLIAPALKEYFEKFSIVDSMEVTQWRLFGNAEWRISPAAVLNLGATYEERDNGSSYLSSRAGMNYAFNTDHLLRASLSRSNRPPTLAEHVSNLLIGQENPEWGENVGSDAERLDTYELGYSGYFSDRSVALDLRLFYNHFNSLTMRIGDYEPAIYAQLDNYEQAGFDVQLRYTGERDSLSLAYSYVETLEDNYSEILEQTFFKTPEHTLSMLYWHKFGMDWVGSASLYHVDKLRWNYSTPETGPVTWVDLKLAKSFKTTQGDLKLALTAKNIFNEEATELRGRHGGERSLHFSARYSF